MSPIIIMLKRDWIEFRRHAFLVILFWILIPVLIHIFLAIPLSLLINIEVRYLNWSAAGIWISSSSMMAFLVTAIRFRKIQFETRQIDFILQSPVTNVDLLAVIILKGMIFGFLQFMFAMFITSMLNYEYFGAMNIFFIFLQMIVIIFFFSSIGTIFGLLISNSMVFIQSFFIIFLLLTFGMGLFIPMSYYPAGFTSIIGNIPISTVISNIQAIITHDSIHWVSYFLTIGLSGLIIIITLITSHHVLRKI